MYVAGTGRMAAQAPPPVEPDAAAPFFVDTQLEEIRLLINSRDWETLKATFRTNAYYPADFKWRDTLVRNVGIRSRGNGSRSGVKPGLRIDFDRYSTKQKFLGLKSLVLRNNVQDPSSLRERVSMLFFARMGIPAPRELHAKLFVNSEYAGLYTVVEAVDRAFLMRVFGEDKGYLFDYDYDPATPPYYMEYRGSDPSKYVPQPFSPETNELDPHPEIIERLIYTVNSVPAASFRSAIEEYLDVGAFIRYVAVETFLGETDGFIGEWGMNNFYLYRPPQSNRFTILPWDKSQALFGSPALTIWHNITDVPEANRNRLMTRLLESPDLRSLYLDTLASAARSASEAAPADPRGWLEREIEREALQVRDAVYADTSKPYTNAEFEATVEALKVFARQRPGFVLAEAAQSR
jgi:hypothetical protein